MQILGVNYCNVYGTLHTWLFLRKLDEFCPDHVIFGMDKNLTL